MNFLFRYLLTSILLCSFWLKLFSQCPSYEIILKQTSEINSNSSLSNEDRLKNLYALKTNAEHCLLTHDSSYALLLRSISYYEDVVHNNSQLAIKFLADAIYINNTLKERRSKRMALVGYYSVGYYSQNAKLYTQAIAYYDSAVACSKSTADIKAFRMPARQNKAYISFFLGDYEKSVEECILGMNDAVATKDSLQYLIFLNIKAQSLCFENNLPKAQADATLAIQMAAALKDNFELAAAFKTSAFIADKNKDFASAKDYFTKAIEVRKQTGDTAAIAGDYNDVGTFFLNSINEYSAAKKNYLNSISYAQHLPDVVQRASQLALAYSNLGDNSLNNNKLSEAEQYYTTAFHYLNIPIANYLLANPLEAQLRLVEHKELVYNLLTQKTAALLHLFTQQKNTKYLDACLQTALLTDSVITRTRYELTGESSKLFWRNNTRQFFANAMEACYLANDAKLAFYFMEKSRAVLLYDRLNELGASAHLPPGEAAKEEMLQTKIVEAEQQLAQLNPSLKEYTQTEYQYLTNKQELEFFIQSLDKKYPSYYQYKYADSVPSLASLQQYLAKQNQSFVHYFTNDTVMYALAITPTHTRLVKLTAHEFDCHQFAAFLSLCSDKIKLNNNYGLFASLAQHIYTQVFKPLQLPKGNIAVCTDNFLIPFEALCTDANGKDFLLYQYNFSYVYSARTFMKPFISNTPATGNFAGFAPVSFASQLQLVSLNHSADALSEAAGFYSNCSLFTNEKATRNNFFRNAAGYAIITIFSHARADTSDREPVLYMQDSAIHLSELQLLKNPSAQFVLLSACQTNIGKAATGEGVYSLARGFAAAGIPSIAATLWKADEQTIYQVSAKFNEYLAAGMNKSEALQKAKLWFIQSGDNGEHRLPYYWANMVLIGNTQPVILIKDNYNLWIAASVLSIVLISIVVLILKRKSSRRFIKNSIGVMPQEQLIDS